MQGRAQNRSIAVVANELFDIYGLDPLPAVEYVLRPRRVDTSALTAEELRWMSEADLTTGEDE